ncbi:uncharacterized protein [Euphorbia lathyris]|uniref:uncharacterized protein n=1 Tax=Euphorbia lathyris TaxID=212925 RepID=UPI00331391CB
MLCNLHSKFIVHNLLGPVLHITIYITHISYVIWPLSLSPPPITFHLLLPPPPTVIAAIVAAVSLSPATEELQRLSGIAYDPRTGSVDVQEKSLERWHAYLQNSKHGLALAKKELANLDLLHRVFGGQTAHGVGGNFAPAIAKVDSYLTKNVEDLTINDEEGSGDSETDKNEHNDVVFPSATESISPPKSAVQKVSRPTSSKRKSEESITRAEFKRRQTSFDTVIQLLSSSCVASSSSTSKAQMVSDTLSSMGVPETRGDQYFVTAVRYLNEEKYADSFLALRNDNQRWIFLKDIGLDGTMDYPL